MKRGSAVFIGILLAGNVPCGRCAAACRGATRRPRRRRVSASSANPPNAGRQARLNGVVPGGCGRLKLRPGEQAGKWSYSCQPRCCCGSCRMGNCRISPGPALNVMIASFLIVATTIPPLTVLLRGVPRALYTPSPFQIIQPPGYVMLLFERMNWRQIPLDGTSAYCRRHPVVAWRFRRPTGKAIRSSSTRRI